jgi:hypothetical protein
MAAWTAGILLVLGLVWFVGAVVVPLVRVHRAAHWNMHYSPRDSDVGVYQVVAFYQVRFQAQELGDPSQSARIMALYLRLPKYVASRHERVSMMLDACRVDAEERFTRSLITDLGHKDALARLCAAQALAYLPSLYRSPGMIEAVPVLEKLLNDEDTRVRSAAAEALKKIRGEEPPK